MTDAKYQYRKEIASNATPQHLVVLLYEQVIQDIHRAIAAIAANDIPGRTDELSHALQVVGELQARLDMERGGSVAENLDRYYSVLRRCLLQAQFSGAGDILQSQISQLVSLREAWLEVERTHTSLDQPGTARPPALDNANECATPRNWKA